MKRSRRPSSPRAPASVAAAKHPPPSTSRIFIVLVYLILSCLFVTFAISINIAVPADHMTNVVNLKWRNGKTANANTNSKASMGMIAYGTRGMKRQTADLVEKALTTGFRHIVTANYHQDHNETGVGFGWKNAVQNSQTGLRRSDIYLQTMFVPVGSPNYNGENVQLSMAEQVTRSIDASLRNLQTEYIDGVLFHNFRAKLIPVHQMMEAYRALEVYVDRGIIRDLGISNVHDAVYLETLVTQSKHKPRIIQNRFHTNRGFDVKLRPKFREWNLQPQTFWTLTGNGGARKNIHIVALAAELGLTPATLLYAFVISLGSTPLIGTHSAEHMRDDVTLAMQSESVFRDVEGEDSDRKLVAKVLGIKYACVRDPQSCAE